MAKFLQYGDEANFGTILNRCVVIELTARIDYLL